MQTNGVVTVGNDPHDTSSEVEASFQQAWVAHLQATFGGAASGGVKFYALDNEVMLWNSTHRDVHPAPTTYDETWAKAASYGARSSSRIPPPRSPVRSPGATATCSVRPADNCLDGQDRQAHGGLPFVAWYLQQVCAHPLAGGVHAVDVLDLHYYPQGADVALSDDDSAPTAARRLASLKELYDPDWVSDSWISDLGDGDANHYDKPNLIPRVRAWIDQYCPGTRLAITEYNWGNDDHRQRRGRAGRGAGDLRARGRRACHALGRAGSRQPCRACVHALSELRRRGRASCRRQHRAQSANVDQIGAYAFQGGARIAVVLTNKDPSAHDVTVSFDSSRSGSWTLYGFDAEHAVHALSSGTIAGTTLTLSALPPISANLLVVGGSDAIFANGFD